MTNKLHLYIAWMISSSLLLSSCTDKAGDSLLKRGPSDSAAASAIVAEAAVDLERCQDATKVLLGRLDQLGRRMNGVPSLNEVRSLNPTESNAEIAARMQMVSQRAAGIASAFHSRVADAEDRVRAECKPTARAVLTKAERLYDLGYDKTASYLESCSKFVADALTSLEKDEAWKPAGGLVEECPRAAWDAAEKEGLTLDRPDRRFPYLGPRARLELESERLQHQFIAAQHPIRLAYPQREDEVRSYYRWVDQQFDICGMDSLCQLDVLQEELPKLRYNFPKVFSDSTGATQRSSSAATLQSEVAKPTDPKATVITQPAVITHQQPVPSARLTSLPQSATIVGQRPEAETENTRVCALAARKLNVRQALFNIVSEAQVRPINGLSYSEVSALVERASAISADYQKKTKAAQSARDCDQISSEGIDRIEAVLSPLN